MIYIYIHIHTYIMYYLSEELERQEEEEGWKAPAQDWAAAKPAADDWSAGGATAGAGGNWDDMTSAAQAGGEGSWDNAAAGGAAPRAKRQYSEGGDDTVGNPHRAQIYNFDIFELIILLELDEQLPVEQFEATVSQSTVPSPLFSIVAHFFFCYSSF